MRISTARIIAFGLLQAAFMLVVATFIVFMLMHLVQGDIAITLAGEMATRERIEEIRAIYGLDQPLLIQYASWLMKVFQGDLSVSLLSGEPVLDSIQRRLPVTLLIAAVGMVISLGLGIPVGVFAAMRPRSWVDSFVTSFASIGIALPNFWLAMILVSFLALGSQLFPVSGMVDPRDDLGGALYYAFLPAVALAASGVAEVARQTRSALMEVQSSQYVRTLYAKGLTQRSIFWRHGLKNISVTLLTVSGLLFNRLLGGTVVVEAVFAISGIGSLVVAAATGKDMPVVQGVILVMVLIVVLVNLLIEVLYGILDPRVNHK